MEPLSNTSAIILSAGNSERMGEHKALLKFDSERTFIQKITETYLLAGIDQIIVVVNAELFNLINKNNLALPEKLLLIVNNKPELGRFYSLQTGIKEVKSGNYTFFQNIDNPLTSEKLLRELYSSKEEADVLIPVFRTISGHPVLISPVVTAEILIASDPDLRIDQFLKRFKVLKIRTTDHAVEANINSPEDYAKWI